MHERCHTCKASLIGGYIPNYYTVGEPVIECARCTALNSRASKCTEWPLMNSRRKLSLIALAIYWGIAYSAAIGLCLSFLLNFLMNSSTGTEETGEFLAANIRPIVYMSLTLGLGISLVQLRFQVIESLARMADPSYLAKLRRVGLME